MRTMLILISLGWTLPALGQTPGEVPPPPPPPPALETAPAPADEIPALVEAPPPAKKTVESPPPPAPPTPKKEPASLKKSPPQTDPAASRTAETAGASKEKAAPATARVIKETLAGMGTRLQILVYTADEENAREAMVEAFAEMTRIEARMSEWSAASDVSKLNRAAGEKPIRLSEDTLRVLTRGLEISRLSKGAFSVTWAALASSWDFSGSPKLPDAVRLKQRTALVNDTKLTLDPVSKTGRLELAGMAVGLGAIAKGYAADRALEVLNVRGFENALIFAGGDIAVSGSKGKKPWLVGIQDPRAQGFFAVISPKNEAVVTSGDYERYFELNGKRYHHIVDPKTGMPALGTRSVTVVTGDAMSADALATAIFVLGPKEGMALAESQSGVEAMIVDAANNVTLSSGLQGRIRMVRPPSN